MVLASNEVMSVVGLFYSSIQWIPDQVVIGLNAGDGVRFLVPSTAPESVAEDTNLAQGLQLYRGLYGYRVDLSDVLQPTGMTACMYLGECERAPH